MSLLHFFRTPGLSISQTRQLLSQANSLLAAPIQEIRSEACFNVQVSGPMDQKELETLTWLLAETFHPEGFGEESFLGNEESILEVGPRMNFTTAWSTNAVGISHACGLGKIQRIERSRRFLLDRDKPLDEGEVGAFLSLVHDRMTETRYPEPLTSFDTGMTPEKVFSIPLLEEGRVALERVNQELGLAFDDWDLDYYTDLFVNRIGRNPTSVEAFDIAQSNSEHSRHWFFKGRLIVDGQEMPDHLISVVQRPLRANPSNSVIAFKDNSSSISGYTVRTLIPGDVSEPSPLLEGEVEHDILFTAETHNFPSGVAPFPGAETGTGGRIRDTHATGRGSLVVAGTAAYCVGNLQIPGYPLPWEDPEFRYPTNLASPLDIEIEASNGASDYGNKFGEPVIQGYTRSFGLRLPNGERREWIKPIMFSGGIGQMDARHREKGKPEVGMLVVKIGGPAYRIGMGGGAASSMVQGENVEELDFNAVQRGDAEMEQKVNRVIRACVELGDRNPIISIHDQGAGGNCNVLKELVEPAGARIDVRAIPVGDETLSVMEIWGAEYQEQDALLLRPQERKLFQKLCDREKVPAAFVGEVTGDGRIVLYDARNDSTPVNMELDHVLGAMPQKTFQLKRMPAEPAPLTLPEDLTVRGALDRVLRLLSVGSKRFLTNKVDRCVTGLVARQQCAGPLQLTVADVAVIAQSHFGVTGGATAIGEQPIKGLLDPVSMARMTVGEALTNLVWARISALDHVKCSGNWMWAAKLPGEGAALHDAAVAMAQAMEELGIAADGGKDSLSMAALAPTATGDEETVKAPGSLVVSAYATCPDITKTVTPDLKLPDQGKLFYVDLGGGRNRLGGSALAHVFGQIGERAPDLDDPTLLKGAFEVVQSLLEEGALTAGHDRSDGGLVTTLLEMAFAGNCGIDVTLEGLGHGSDPLHPAAPFPVLFSEELGLVFEASAEEGDRIRESFWAVGVPCTVIGTVTSDPRIRIRVGDLMILDEDMGEMRDIWEETSYELDRLQADPEKVDEERQGLKSRRGPTFQIPFEVSHTAPEILAKSAKPRVAVVREEGSNSDRELGSAFHLAGFEVWDVSMSDLMDGRIRLDSFQGLGFPGGFAYADVLDSAKGWAGAIRFNPALLEQFTEFQHRPDSFSIGICNGCQLSALLGWVPWSGIETQAQPRFIQNSSGRFESRFATVGILESPSIMLQGMAGATLGIWVAHGEGRAYFPDPKLQERVLAQGLAPVRFVDDTGEATTEYPLNPNGSPAGIAALTSADGRHLAIMPHPERSFLTWQWGWIPREWKGNTTASPWLKMFQNARSWCEGVG
ncbi:MAG: phosphoribosylformylglycinamidine synthase [Gemmatimonadota bacterium]|jgi:phosphoribosylformylglycinamidine synthase